MTTIYNNHHVAAADTDRNMSWSSAYETGPTFENPDEDAMQQQKQIEMVMILYNNKRRYVL